MCEHADTCPDSTFCDGTETCCTSSSGCNGVPRGSCEQGPPINCPDGEFCSEALETCVECTSSFHCDDGESCTSNVCLSDGTCSNPPLPDNTSCNLTGCFENEHCVDGVCVGTQIDCQAIAPACKIGNCNATTGECTFTNAPNGTSCTDGNNCTAVDTCVSGVCVGGPANGCVDLRLILGQTVVNVGDVVDVHLYADSNGCLGGALGCPVGTQPVAGVEAVFTWDPTYLELANPSVIGQFNPLDACTTSSACNTLCGSGVPCDTTTNQCASPATCDFTCGPTTFDTYDLGTSSYPKDCDTPSGSGDQINGPCPTGWPANDGTGYYTGQQQFQCGGEAGDPICVTPTGNGLRITTWKFRALKATRGINNGAPVQLQPCILRTRTIVSDGLTTGRDVLRSVPTGPVTVAISCTDDTQCPAGLGCSGGVCQSCPAPTVAVAGSRYLAITPSAGTSPVGFKITGQDSAVACVSGHVQATGLVATTPVFRTPDQWKTMSDPFDDPNSNVINVRDNDLVAGMSYSVQADCNSASPGTSLSSPTTVRLWKYGDCDNNNSVDILDATRILDGFRGTFHTIACTSDANCTNVAPYRSCDLSVGKCRWIYRENVDIIGAAVCQPEREISIIDATTSLDAFRNLADACRNVCP